MARQEKLLIGDVSRRAGVNPKTVRFYEAQGLVSPAGRTPKGYRLFDHEVVSRLGFIKKAQSLGFALSEIREILALRDGGSEPCDHVEAQVSRKILEIEERLVELQRLKASLEELLGRGATADASASVCPRIEGSRASE